MSNYEAWQQRVVDELAELEGRRKKLLAFTGTEAFRSLDAIDRDLLWKQLGHMSEYAHILERRIDLFGGGAHD